jgi:peptidoglycan-associated lipoprotein
MMRRILTGGVAACCLILAGCADKAVTEAKTVGPAPVAEQHKPLAPGDVRVADFARTVGDRVFFDTDQATLSAEARTRLAGWIAYGLKYPDIDFLIEGHADERGTREYNLALGERRANAVKEFLVAGGLPARRLVVTSFGKERPAVVGSGEEVWAQNRRVVAVPR